MADASTGGTSPIGACPYLRAGAAAVAAPDEGATGRAGAGTHACVAGRDAFSPGPRQRSLMCETARFGSCPRFPAADRRGQDRRPTPPRAPVPWATAAAAEPVVGTRPRVARGVPLPTAVAGLILVLALVAALAFTAVRGGLDLVAGPGASASPAPTAAAGTPRPSPAATSGATAPPSTTGPSPTSMATPPSSVPAATLVPSAGPSPAATPAQLDPRYKGLKPCPDRPDCYLYVVQRGDTLTSIAASFGIPLEVVRVLNPELRNPSLIRVGQKIRIPAPG